MQKILWLFLSLAVMLEARENPFETSMSPQDVGKTTQVKDESTNFTTTKLSLPSSARILKSASVTFQNLDGSISEEIVAIDQNVDWHTPLILSAQNAEAKPITSPVNAVSPTPKTVEKKETLPAASVAPKEDHGANSTMAANTPLGSNYKLNEDLSFFINQNEITIFTKDRKIRDFLITDPYKIVVDFKKTNSYATKTLEFQKAPFVSVTLGDHDDFYRIAILLDGHYRYDLQVFNGGYVIKMK